VETWETWYVCEIWTFAEIPLLLGLEFQHQKGAPWMPVSEGGENPVMSNFCLSGACGAS